MESESSPRPMARRPGWMLFLAASGVGGVLRFVASGRIFAGWVGIVIAAVGAFYVVRPARVTWDGEQWVRQPPDADGLLSQRLLAAVACLIGVFFFVAAAVNLGTFSS